MKSILNKLNVVSESQIPKGGPNNNTGNSKSSNSFVKLPKIAIPTFSGKHSEWTTFHDLFISLVHEHSSLDNVQKLHYLKSHLTGEAEQLVRHTPISAANYSECWSQLERRYSEKIVWPKTYKCRISQRVKGIVRYHKRLFKCSNKPQYRCGYMGRYHHPYRNVQIR